MGRLGFLFNPEGNMPSKEIKSRDVEYDFLGLLTETVDGKGTKFNGAIKLDDDSIYVEERSRLNGKVKDAFEISYDDISIEDVNKVADNKVQFDLPDRTFFLKTLDNEMLEGFETKLKNKLMTGSFEIEEDNAGPVVLDIPTEIRKYHELLEDGIISQDEFDAKKRELLNS